MTTRALAIRRTPRRSRVWTTHSGEASVATDVNTFIDSPGIGFETQMSMGLRGVTLAALRGFAEVHVGAVSVPSFGPFVCALTWMHRSSDADDLQNPITTQGSWQYYFGSGVSVVVASRGVTGLPNGDGSNFPIWTDAKRKQPAVNLEPNLFVRHSIGVTLTVNYVYRALWLLP